jgi:hypothetical protein
MRTRPLAETDTMLVYAIFFRMGEKVMLAHVDTG